MTDWLDDIAQVSALQEKIERDPSAVSSVASSLLDLAHSNQWLVQHTAIEALGDGLQHRPKVGVSLLDDIIRTTLDESIPTPSNWGDSIIAVATTAPDLYRDAVINGFETVPSEQRSDAGEASLTYALERIVLKDLTEFSDSLDDLREICQECGDRARKHLLRIHLALVDGKRQAVRPVIPDLLAEFERGNSKTRRVAADILCALARHPEDGHKVIGTMITWLATHPREPQENRSYRQPKEPIMCPSLSDGPSAGILGVTQVLARIAEETPGPVVPHCADIAASLASWESTSSDQWPRSNLARALAAVARQRPTKVVSKADDIEKSCYDDSEFVRYWAAQAFLALSPYRPDVVSPEIVEALLTDTNPDIRALGADLAVESITLEYIDSDELVATLCSVLSDGTEIRKGRVLGVFASIAQHDPDTVRPVLATLEKFLEDTLTASDAATVFGEVAKNDPEAVADAVPTLVDCLFADSITVRSAAANTLATVTTASPPVLDDHLSVLLSVIEQEPDDIEAVSDVLVTIPNRPVDADETVFDFVSDRSNNAAPTARKTATQLLGAFAKTNTETEAAVAALKDRLDDSHKQVREAAVDALATHIADSAAASLVKSCYLTGTDHWRAVSADLLARATLLDASWPTANFQHWLADCLHETTGQTRRSFIEATGYICGQTNAEEQLVAALLACLEDHTVAETAFNTVRNIVNYGETAVPGTELAPAVERAVLDPNRHIPPACLALLPHVTSHLSEHQRVTNRLMDRLTAGKGNTGEIVAALSNLCRHDVKIPEAKLVAALKRYAINEPVSPRNWACMHFGRVLQDIDGDKVLRETFVPMAISDEDTEQRAIGYSVLASVAEVWPAGVRPAADMLRTGVRSDEEQVSRPALSALVALGREYPAVLHPISEWLTSRPASSAGVELRRRRYEGIALLAADGIDLNEAGYRSLRVGVLDSDTAVTEYALEATAELADLRLIPVLDRLDDGVPDWKALPDHCRTKSDAEPNPMFKDFLPSEERTLTADEVLNKLER